MRQDEKMIGAGPLFPSPDHSFQAFHTKEIPTHIFHVPIMTGMLSTGVCYQPDISHIKDPSRQLTEITKFIAIW
jgi:hypothetical protein